jgi:cathepsin D
VQVEFGSGKLNGIVNKEIIKVDGLELKQAFFIEITK